MHVGTNTTCIAGTDYINFLHINLITHSFRILVHISMQQDACFVTVTSTVMLTASSSWSSYFFFQALLFVCVIGEDNASKDLHTGTT